MDWTGAAHTRNYGYAMLGTLAMGATGIGLEELELWKSLRSPFLFDLG